MGTGKVRLSSKPHHNRRLGAVVLAGVSLLLTGAPPGVCQADFEKGYQGFQSYHGSDFDSVNLANGNLVLDIPLLSFPQRGGLAPVVISVRSNSSTFQSDPPYLNGPPDTKQHEVASGIVGAPWGQPHVTIDPGGVSWREERITTASHTASGGPEYLSRFVAIDESGATHSLGGSVANTMATNLPSIKYTVDGSGFMLQPGTSQSGPLLVDRKGNMGGLIDPNGNAITLSGPCVRPAGSGDFFNPSVASWEGYAHGTASATSIVDSVGRHIPNPSYLPPVSAYSCLIDVDATYHPAAPDPNGCEMFLFPSQNNTQITIGFCYQQISVSGGIATPLAVGTPIPNGGANTSSCTFTIATQQNPLSCEPLNETWWVLTSVKLPNGTQWTFSYNTLGQVSSVTMPTGATVSYTYQPRIACGNPPGQIPVAGTPTWPFSNLMSSQMVATRTLNVNDGSPSKVWTYTNTIGSGWAGQPNQGLVTVTGPSAQDDPLAPNGSDTVHVFSLIGGSVCGPYETETQYYEGSQASGGELKQIDTSYTNTTWDYANPTNFSNYVSVGVFPKTVTTTMFGLNGTGSVIQQDSYLYDSYSVSPGHYSTFGTYQDYVGVTHPFSFGQLIAKTESDWVSGSVSPQTVSRPMLPTVPILAPLRTAVHTNVWQTAWQYYAQNLIDLPCLETTYSGVSSSAQPSCTPPSPVSNEVAQTAYSYDEPAFLPASQQAAVLGNLTSVTRWLQGSSVAIASHSGYSAGGLSSHGMPTDTYDPKGNHTVLVYDSTGLFLKEVIHPSTTVNGQPIQLSEYPSYDPGTGELLSRTDENGQTTYFTYDSMRRLTTVAYPDQGSEVYTYYDSLDAHPYFTYSKYLNPATYNVTGFADGLGRSTVTQITSIPEGAITKRIVYDNIGRVLSISNPFVGSSGGSVSYQYDSLGRKTYQCQQDNALFATPNDSCVPHNSYLQWIYSGNTIQALDELHNSWLRVSDGLGRLIAVTEPGNLLTTYSYDVLGNLLCADQWGIAAMATACSSPRARAFHYDTLSRLIQASNPETGLIKYGYLANGFLCSGNVSMPCSKTDARQVTLSYSYDQMNRVVAKSYSGDPTNTPSSCYQYDASSVQGVASTPNLIGRLANAWTQIGSCPPSSVSPVLPSSATLSLRSILQYDTMGRIQSERQCTLSNCAASTSYGLSYTYDMGGNLITHTSGVVSGSPGSFNFVNCYDPANRLTSVFSASSNGGANCATGPAEAATMLFSSAVYSPFGGLTSAVYGSGLMLNRTFDSRLRISSETDSGSQSQSTKPGARIQVLGNVDQTH